MSKPCKECGSLNTKLYQIEDEGLKERWSCLDCTKTFVIRKKLKKRKDEEAEEEVADE